MNRPGENVLIEVANTPPPIAVIACLTRGEKMY